MTQLCILQGDVRETLRQIPDDSVHCVVTSPPYWALRSYLPKDHPLKSLEIGSEPTPEAYVQTMVEVFREVRRALHPSGTCWVNIGDSYAANRGGTGMPAETLAGGISGHGESDTLRGRAERGEYNPKRDCEKLGLKHKDLCLIPERLALALQADGWWVRSRICWAKKSPMPESVTDRPTSAWEHIWLLAKSARYFYDAEAVKQPVEYGRRTWSSVDGVTASKRCERTKASVTGSNAHFGASLRNFWLLGPEPYSGAHFASFPSEIPKRAILAGTSARGCCPKCLAPYERVVEKKASNSHQNKGYLVGSGRNDGGGTRHGSFIDGETRTLGWRPTCDCQCETPQGMDEHPVNCDCHGTGIMTPIPCTVFDPFAGTGTVAAVALELGRHAITCELNPEYVKLIENRTRVTHGLPLA